MDGDEGQMNWYLLLLLSLSLLGMDEIGAEVWMKDMGWEKREEKGWYVRRNEIGETWLDGLNG